MSYPDFSRLQSLGLKPAHLQTYLSLGSNSALGRIVAVDRGLCRVVTSMSDGPENQSIPGQPHWGAGLAEFPIRPSPDRQTAVGDWVTWVPSQAPRIERVLERSSFISRQSVGATSDTQAIAANVDVVFVVTAFSTTAKLTTRALNPRRLERYVAAIRDGGALPVIIINKTDLSEAPDRAIDELRGSLRETEVIATSTLASDLLLILSPWLIPGETVALVGPSGVGKSTLVNQLLRHETLPTGAVRNTDAKGRHTTTRRQLLKTSNGVLIIDTPGMREFGVALTEGIETSFPALAEFAEQCRFADCRHETEPGCAVRKAIESGALTNDQVESFRELENESLRHQARHDAHSRHQLHQKDRNFGKMIRETMKEKRGRN